MSRLNFQLENTAKNSRARAARFKTLHNEVLTPLFMPVGTHATVRHQTFADLENSGSQILLANTYHLLVRPGPEVFRHFGGIHKFMNWKKSVLTDSGGFQIFSLPGSRRMTEEGASFQSYVDGSTHLLSPEKSIETQIAIGSDIMMVLDECIPSTSDHARATDAMGITHRWALRSLAARGTSPQSLFAIVQGACFEDLRKQSAEFLTQHPFDGFAIGGLAVGETKAEREDFTAYTTQFLPEHLPRYLMGVGTPNDLLEAVHRGVDMFDCIMPAALAEQGVGFTSMGRFRFLRGVYRLSDLPLDPNCACPTCQNYSRGYLHHLLKRREPIGIQLLGAHNIYFYHELMRQMRRAILEDRFYDYYLKTRERLALGDDDNPVHLQKSKRRKIKPTSLGNFEIHIAPEAFASIKSISSGEIMHSVINPDVEANTLYVGQCRLLERRSRATQPLIVWDVGLGAAHNAMAALHLCEANPSSQAVKIISFENDLDSLKLTLLRPDLFKHIRHEAPHTLLSKRTWKSNLTHLEWTLFEGDFLTEMSKAEAPDIIFYDPFSSKTDSPLWTLPCFQKLFAHCQGKSTELFTYSSSTAVRASLMSAGFFVARGLATGPRSDTTIALSRPLPHPHKLLDHIWLERWERSGAKIPTDLKSHQIDTFLQSIRQHEQFRPQTRQ